MVAWTVFWGGLKFVFKDWRVVLGLVVALVIGYFVWTYHHVENELANAQKQAKLEKETAAQLRDDLTNAKDANSENAAIIDKLKSDNAAATATIDSFHKEMQKTTKNVEEIRKKIDTITTPPTKVTPYIAEAIKGVQQMRDEENPPPTPAEQALSLDKNAPPKKKGLSSLIKKETP